MTLLPLEEWLQAQATKSRNSFPTNENYFERYKAQKDKFSELVYPYIGAALSTFEETGESLAFFTEHGQGHVEAVIRTAGLLLGCKDKKSKVPLEPYEIYLLLMSIISHDVGNIEGRKEHELRAYNLLTTGISATLQADTAEARQIHNIVVSHTSKGAAQPLGAEKDTITDLPAEEESSSVPYRPRAIASILRIADELCEDRRRIPLVLKDNEAVWNSDSAPFLRYAEVIDNVNINSQEGKIEIRISISKGKIKEKYIYTKKDGSRSEEFLVDNIRKRLSKVSAEASYCLRFLRNILEFSSITAKIEIFQINERNKNPETIEKIVINLHEEGYPHIENVFMNRYAEFDGQRLKEKYFASEMKHE